MRKLFVLVFATILITVAQTAWTQTSKQLDSSATVSPNGGIRYELFQGEYTISNEGTAFKANGVFKIDTATGRTWIYTEGKMREGKFYKEWVPINN